MMSKDETGHLQDKLWIMHILLAPGEIPPIFLHLKNYKWMQPKAIL